MKRFLGSLIVLALVPITARAQTAFSINAVGYVDVQLNSGSNLVANPLNAASNTMRYLWPRLPDGSSFLSWNAQVQAFDSTNQYSAATGWSNPEQVFVQPEAGFLVVSEPVKISFHGEPWQFASGPGCLSYPPNTSFSGWFPPGTCGICEPEACPPFGDGTVVSKWDAVFQVYFDYIYFGGFGWVPSDPVLTAGHGYRLFNPAEAFGRSPFRGPLFPTATPVEHGRPFRFIRGVQRDGTNLTFRIEGSGGGGYSMLSSSNLNGPWQVVAAESNSPVTFSARADGTRGFFKIHPPYDGKSSFLISRARVGTSFSFDFFAPSNTTFEIQRAPSFPSTDFQTITNVTAAANTVVTVVDHGATGPSGYYRVAH
jgi:hypothetical protein